MQITKSQVEERKAQLMALADQHMANYNACIGGIETCTFILDILDQSEDNKETGD
jgi:hypothetical protein